ncbi:C40 family peptidase [Chitinophaga horti]|uniref:C40 family peptidase n=1 Tax=Chitinophaga horti TaxID=2920382 RepID=A0ABY6J536_9BACT|nr:C40 family peptidase [Chitinophaga horti]UYQ94723.1 C40 family peptidase [Chitinophaga horti]
MPYAVTIVPVMPMRAEPKHRSEVISQVLFGEFVETEPVVTDGWVKVRNRYDNYEGWVTVSHVEIVEKDLFDAPARFYAPAWVNRIIFNGQPMHVPFGCEFSTNGSQVTKWGKYDLQFESPLTELPATVDPAAVLKHAPMFLNTSYLWGGKSVFGVDCSGFTQTVYRLAGIPLQRDAYQQAAQGQGVGFLQEAQPGDLAFFDNAEGRITHVGVLLNDHEIIHSAGKVRIDDIDNEGIVNRDTGERTHKLRLIRRYW